MGTDPRRSERERSGVTTRGRVYPRGGSSPEAGAGGTVSRRRALALGGLGGLGAAATALSAAGCDAPASDAPGRGAAGSGATGGRPGCVLTAEQTAGPYYLDLNTVRKDITEGKGGAPLKLHVTVVDAKSCAPIGGAAVEIWHCDASGYYSGFTDRRPGGTPPPEDGVGNERTFLRGTQVTAADGIVEFQTIVPGWYAPRAVHIHTKVHVGGRATDRRYEGGHVAHTGQLYFPDGIVEAVRAQRPYAEHSGRFTPLGDDAVYGGGGAEAGLLAVTRSGPGGYRGTITVGVDPKAG
jgi:protocatechuate 3,4-dioxygenase beta subunit